MFLLFLIFMLEMAFALLPKFVGEMTTMIAKVLLTVTNEELNLRAEIKDLKEEQSNLSITDDFARYAKLQRKIDKLMAVVKETGNERKQRVSYLRMAVTVGIYVLHPLSYLPPVWLFPLGNFVAFPTGISGGIGLGCWVIVSNSVIHRFRGLVGV
ncbi:tryptophan rich basic protein [Elysia marginata]|uniref:Guided entry of tail-anchored proteins factor 1 n=1 Tax=Elysia marginata TaxID=1093978 RepID=A0AAV4FLT4_9GAST|nr:tryptophan rich basic protein [Elysia marginata]